MERQCNRRLMTMVDNGAPEKYRLGEILIKRNIITAQQLETALAQQKYEKAYLGEILVRLGYLEERDILGALVVQCNLPYIAIRNYNIEHNIVSLIPSDMARKYHVMPLDRVGNILSVVMADPLNESIKQELVKETHCNIAPFIATKAEIAEAIERYY